MKPSKDMYPVIDLWQKMPYCVDFEKRGRRWFLRIGDRRYNDISGWLTLARKPSIQQIEKFNCPGDALKVSGDYFRVYLYNDATAPRLFSGGNINPYFDRLQRFLRLKLDIVQVNYSDDALSVKEESEL